ncbi:MAG: serine/threonine protein kinase, partial [Deltaproteobacteria bacterium]
MRSQGWAPVHPIFTSGPPFRRIRRFPRSKWQDRRNLPAQLHRFSMMRALPQGDSVDPGDFGGNARFQVLSRLGAGPMGVVYRARDLAQGREVALKTLQRFDPAGLYRFKHEFRSFANVSHPNLVTLYELISDEDRWFFTMELVEGVDFRRWIANGDVDRLRDAFRQLALGVEALHATGRLHRDIKPSNVMVDSRGRVVLLDFGLVSARRSASAGDSILDPMGGTPAYMSPEQAAGAELGPACDWYSVGAMLYDILAGRLPFEGTVIEVLDAKIRREAPPLRRDGIPEDLAELATALVHRNPDERPKGSEVLRRLR